jgi:hypothetical protein
MLRVPLEPASDVITGQLPSSKSRKIAEVMIEIKEVPVLFSQELLYPP